MSPQRSDKHDILSVFCRPEDSLEMERWIAHTIQGPVLVEEGNPCRLSFASSTHSSLENLLLKEALYSLGALEIQMESYEKKDWQELWKEQGFKRFSVGNALTVLPAWDHDPAPEPFILIDPHLAFGTGWHETTHQVLVLVWKTIMDKGFLGRILDFGSGTGILGIAALKLDPSAGLVAIDNDPYAVEATISNLQLNGMESRGKVFDEWNRFRSDDVESFSLILANVTGGVVLHMAKMLWECVLPEGSVIFSGVSKEEAPQVEEFLFSLSRDHESYPGERYNTYRLKKGRWNG